MIYPGLRKLSFGVEDENTTLFVLNAACKYKMVSVVEEIFKRLIDLADNDAYDPNLPLALRVYSIAITHGMDTLARAAAWASLRGREFRLGVPELKDISGLDYFRLLEYHHAAGERAANALDTVRARKDFKPLIECLVCRNSRVPRQAEWWEKYSTVAKEALAKCPRTQDIYIYNHSSLQTAHETALKCSSCSLNIVERWSVMCTTLKEEINGCLRTVRTLLFITL